jgi:hypothetical protein
MYKSERRTDIYLCVYLFIYLSIYVFIFVARRFLTSYFCLLAIRKNTVYKLM